MIEGFITVYPIDNKNKIRLPVDDSFVKVRLSYCFKPYQRLWLYNGAPLVAFYDTLGIRRT